MKAEQIIKLAGVTFLSSHTLVLSVLCQPLCQEWGCRPESSRGPTLKNWSLDLGGGKWGGGVGSSLEEAALIS